MTVFCITHANVNVSIMWVSLDTNRAHVGFKLSRSGFATKCIGPRGGEGTSRHRKRKRAVKHVEVLYWHSLFCSPAGRLCFCLLEVCQFVRFKVLLCSALGRVGLRRHTVIQVQVQRFRPDSRSNVSLHLFIFMYLLSTYWLVCIYLGSD